MNLVDISLFPIPGNVSLPYTVLPLHIFEPRYRKMIQDAVEQKRRIGVAHTKKEIAPSKSSPSATTEEVLGSNQETYEAHSIFSAGYPEILETLPDGRMIIQITMDGRYEAIEEVQQIPYKIVKCKAYEDEGPQEEPVEVLRSQLDEILLRLPVESPEKLKAHLESQNWRNLTHQQYSFAIYSLVIFNSDILQKVLELKSESDRIGFLIDALIHPVSQ